MRVALCVGEWGGVEWSGVGWVGGVGWGEKRGGGNFESNLEVRLASLERLCTPTPKWTRHASPRAVKVQRFFWQTAPQHGTTGKGKTGKPEKCPRNSPVGKVLDPKTTA